MFNDIDKYTFDCPFAYVPTIIKTFCNVSITPPYLPPLYSA